MHVALGSCWRRGASPVWSVHEGLLPDNRWRMVRWVARGGELQLATMHAAMAEFTAGQWRQVSLEEMSAETRIQEQIAREQRNPPGGVNAMLEQEHERIRRTVEELHRDARTGGVTATREHLRDLARFLRLEGPKTVAALIDMAERAEAHLDELHGPAFAAWRCDACGKVVVPEDTELATEQVYCGVHGPMRHVLCRVTADSPPEAEPATVAPVAATPDGGGGS